MCVLWESLFIFDIGVWPTVNIACVHHPKVYTKNQLIEARGHNAVINISYFKFKYVIYFIYYWYWNRWLLRAKMPCIGRKRWMRVIWAMLWLGVSSWTTIKFRCTMNGVGECATMMVPFHVWCVCKRMNGMCVCVARAGACLVAYTKRILGFVEQQSNEADHSEIDCIDWNSFVDFMRELNITNINK